MDEHQANKWENIVHNSAFTVRGICRRYAIDESSLRAYLYKGRRPRKENAELMEEIMSYLEKNKRIPRHPSYGYATSEQIEELKSLSVGHPRREYLLRQIEKQTRTEGKID